MQTLPADRMTPVTGKDSLQARWKRRWSGGLWHVVMGAYLAVLYTATHIPKPPPALMPIRNDKVLHFLVYFGFGLILGMKPLRTVRSLGIAWCLLLLFAAGDELTQPFFRRSAEWQDWFADAIGGATGLLTAVMLVQLLTLAVRCVPGRSSRLLPRPLPALDTTTS